MEESTLNSINQFFNEAVSNTSSNEKRSIMRQKTMSLANFSSGKERKQLLRTNSIIPEEASDPFLRKASHMPNLSIDMTEQMNSKLIKRTLFKSKTKAIIDIPEYDQVQGYNERGQEIREKEINTKIMSLLSPKTSVDMKFRRMTSTKNQIEKLCNSLEIIFESTDKIQINLPLIFESDKGDKKFPDSEIVNKFKSGNFLFLFMDHNIEFLFGIILSGFSGKTYAKVFKKLLNDNNRITIQASPPLEYYESTYEKVTFKSNTILLGTNFKFSFSNYQVNTEDNILTKFLKIGKTKSLISDIHHLNIYDMC
jgi:hypothetical protein